MQATTISPDFTFESKYLTINNSKLHYIEEGQGDPILFLHGIPTSNYLWRNIIPFISPYARCIAPDLIGMGKSDKPDITYRIFDHIQYIKSFIEDLDLENLTLVVHGWGSVIGFALAEQLPDRVKAVAFYESYIGPIDNEHVSLPVKQLLATFPDSKYRSQAIYRDDKLIDKFLRAASLRRLSDEEMLHYRAPFAEPASRKPILQYIEELPLIHAPDDVVDLINSYTAYLEKSKIPKLLIYTVPGFITTIRSVVWCREHLPNLTLADLHEGLHFVQEYNPEAFGQALLDWYQNIAIKK